jgi:serine phosphatase RsbU (regulator of sigma subunit)
MISGALPSEFGDVVAAYVIDLQQSMLALLPVFDCGMLNSLQVETSPAGQAFQHLRAVVVDISSGDLEIGFPTMMWLPLVSGSERLGVLGVRSPAERSGDPIVAVWLARLADQVADLLEVSQRHSDQLIRLRRTRHLNLAAEIQWDLLPPLNYDDATVSLAAALEPAYSVAGDSIDYAVDSNRVRFALFDAVGHGLRAAQMVSLAVGCYRNARRWGLDLSDTVEQIDEAISLHFLEHQFVTGLVGEFDPGTGSLTFVNAGHPPPILIRNELAIGELDASSRLPFGLRHLSPSDG